ncbi:terminase gpA endonuclease subunit [Wohlfahrtiimonas populi]|uniref:terminase gpA endonuclease subunit n=1 Tax=Wohlfahrtiimonas populi TaxID=1940240 RepID=UPI002FCE3526
MATAGIAGFYLNELHSKFEGSSFKILAEKCLTAQYEFKELGKPEKLIAFINSSKGEAYE